MPCHEMRRGVVRLEDAAAVCVIDRSAIDCDRFWPAGQLAIAELKRRAGAGAAAPDPEVLPAPVFEQPVEVVAGEGRVRHSGALAARVQASDDQARFPLL